MGNKIKELEEKLLHKEQENEELKKELDRTHLLMLKKQDEAVKEILENSQLKTENENWRNRSDSWMSKCEQEVKLRELINEQLDQLRAENDELKKTLANDECFINGSKKCVKAFCIDEELRKQLEQEKTLKEMYFTYYKAKHSDIKGEFFRYKQTLTEIKEIAERCYDPVDKENDGFWSILKIISEVEL